MQRTSGQACTLTDTLRALTLKGVKSRFVERPGDRLVFKEAARVTPGVLGLAPPDSGTGLLAASPFASMGVSAAVRVCPPLAKP